MHPFIERWSWIHWKRLVGLSVVSWHPFFIRIKDNALVEWGKTNKSLTYFFHHLKDNETRTLYKQIATKELTIVGKKLKDGNLLVVCSNTKEPHMILQTYQKRWCIESLFKNLKTQGFNMEDTHMKCLTRLHKLMAVVAIAAFLMGLIGCHLKCPYKKTVKSPLYSVFTAGLKWLRHLINIEYESYRSQFMTFLSHAKISEG